jgi:hypothetical protein
VISVRPKLEADLEERFRKKAISLASVYFTENGCAILSADQEEESAQWGTAQVGATHEGIEGCYFLCGHENPFDGWVPFVRIIWLEVYSLDEVLAAFIEVILGKCKEFINKVKVLVAKYFTTKPRRARRRDGVFGSSCH